MLDKAISINLVVLFLDNTMFGLASPFLPKLLEDRGIKSLWTGMIFASNAIIYMIASPIIGKLVDRAGHRNMMVIGSFILAGSVAAFGTILYFESNAALITVAIALRVI